MLESDHGYRIAEASLWDGSVGPHVSKSTLEFHHGKHHTANLDKTNELIAIEILLEPLLRRLAGVDGAASAVGHRPKNLRLDQRAP